MDHSDAELMAAWRHGDPAAFAALVRRWQQPVARFLAHLLGPAGPVPDLCQEVFLRAFQAGPRYRESGAFSAWLYRIALNVARDAGRRRRTTPLDNGELTSPAVSPEAICAGRERADAVEGAVAGLPEPLRLVLVLRHYEGMSFEDIARLTGTPASTLKSRFAAALARLRAQLRHLADDEEDIHP
jgi:RNA polymerase sigma-70 factor (ECF subfamily)